jgi:3-deoxy-D-manno-octulosonic-acid transferase
LIFLYRLIFMAAILVASPYLLFKALTGKHGVTERLGIIPARKSNGRLFWFHAASVGELKVLSTIIPEFQKLIPGLEIAISTTTASGKKRARQLFGNDAIIFLQPLEFNSAILRVVESLRPEKLILVETELWPLLINTTADSGVEIDLVNARMSRKSFRVYRWFATLTGITLRRFTHLLAQSDEDSLRFARLGAPHARAIGNTKFDQVFAASRDKRPAIPLSQDGRLVFVAGSIRIGEDRIFAEIIGLALDKKLPVIFVLAPRHMKDVDQLCGHLNSSGISFDLWTESDRVNFEKDRVLIVNTMGELTNFYLSADLAFVGGSLVTIGGHDPAEPAALGVPVLFGPHMENAAAAANLLVANGAATTVADAGSIIRELQDAIDNRATLKARGLKGKETIAAHAGVSAQIAKIIAGTSL